jgi:hypothetical protein
MPIFAPFAYRTSVIEVEPAAPPTSGLVLWLDNTADSYPGSGTTWFDRSGNGHDFIAINSPTWSSADGWTLNGTTQYLSGSSTANSGLNSIFNTGQFVRDGLSVYAYVVRNAGATDDSVFAAWTDAIASGYKMIFEINGNRTLELGYEGTPNTFRNGNTTGTITNDTPIVVGFEIPSNGVVTAYQDKVALSGNPWTAGASETFRSASPPFHIGARPASGVFVNHFNGKIKAVMVYNRALGATDRASLYDYLVGL